MRDGEIKALYGLAFLVAALSIIAAATGVFYTVGGEPYEVVNQYGDAIKIYGKGIYAHDSYFKAPIFRGTDFIMLFLTVPLLLAATIWDIAKCSLKSNLMLTSLLAMFLYYSTSLAFGVTYNSLHLIYIALFSSSLFAFILAMLRFDYRQIERAIKLKTFTGIYIFLALTGAALFAAWLPDIIGALTANRSLSLIEVYTTEITYVLDMGIISPAAFIAIYLLKSKKGMGYVISTILLTICTIIGIMLPEQTAFQTWAGIILPPPVLITKVGSFVLLAIFALYFNFRLLRSIGE